jgi:threonine aldolase
MVRNGRVDAPAEERVDFRSDNVSGALPEVLEALVAEGRRRDAAYGEDASSRALTEELAALFEHEVAVLPVATGTAANALALALYTPPWGAVYSHAHAHIQVSECGAPEGYTGGAKLVPLEGGADGKLGPRAVSAAIHREGSVHAVQPAVVSVSQATETGCVYTPAELGALAEVARAHGMAVHVDGARFANALVASGHTPAELTWRAGVDVLAFGATKNGCVLAEALILFQPARARELAFRRKRAGQLLSKQRFSAVQLRAYLAEGRWLRAAQHANEVARRLAAGLEARGVELAAPVHTNQVFPRLNDAEASALRARGAAFYDWPTLGAGVRRLVTAFDTRTEDVDAFLHALPPRVSASV